jgi:hypothetical protein
MDTNPPPPPPPPPPPLPAYDWVTGKKPVYDDASLAADVARWKTMDTGAHLDQWMTFVYVLTWGRNHAMWSCGGSQPKGRRYTFAFGKWRDDHFPGMDKSQITALLWFGEKTERIAHLNAIRSTMTDGMRARLNLPTSARKLVERNTGGPKDKKPRKGFISREKYDELADGVEDLRAENMDLALANSVLKDKLAKGGSLENFLTFMSVEDISKAIYAKLDPRKWRAIVETADRYYDSFCREDRSSTGQSAN